MIVFEEVRKRYGQTVALDGVSLRAEKGEIFGYIGPNGAGKTTSIKIMVGLIRDFEGRIAIDGDTVAGSARHRASLAAESRLIGYMPQSSGFQEWRTCSHTLKTFGELSGLGGAALYKRIDAVLERVGLTEYRNARLVHMSGGTLQRLRLAQAILHEPKVLVLDEPMSGLDPASRFRFKEIIRELASEHRLVFFSSHILSDVEDLATRIGILKSGRIKKVGTPAELREEFGLGQIIEVEAADEIAEAFHVFRGAEESVVVNPKMIRIRFPSDGDLDESVRRVMTHCLDQGVRVRSIKHLRPSLEDVYLRMTEDAE